MKCLNGGIYVRSGGPMDHPILVPCGQCIACRLNKARQWSIRCMHEARYHSDNAFVTLTYSSDFLPENSSLVKSDLQKFFKRLRKRGYIFRYYACGEYGDESGRPHYHAILFGVARDLRTQRDISDCWRFGMVHVGDVTLDSANYVAGYVVKKQTGKEGKAFYKSKGLLPPFCLMSRRPGVGAQWKAEFGLGAIKRGFVIAKGKQYGLPRYYRDLEQPGCAVVADRALASYERSCEERASAETQSGLTGEQLVGYGLQVAEQRRRNVDARIGLSRRAI